MTKLESIPEHSQARKLSWAKRVLVIEAGGSGKSTLAAGLGDLLGLEVIHLDRLYWRAGWEQPSRDEWELTVRRLIERDAWVMDGNYSGTLDLRLAAADAVIFLDLPRALRIRRVLVRRLRYRKLRYARRPRPDMAPGCPERLTFQFLKYLWKYPIEYRPGILRKLETLSREKTVLILRTPPETSHLLALLEHSPQAIRTR